LDAFDTQGIFSRPPIEFIVVVGIDARDRVGRGQPRNRGRNVQKNTVAYNETPEAERALISAIQLAKSLGAELRTVTVMAEPPAYAAFAAAGDPSLPRTLENDRLKFYQGIQEKASALAERHGIEVASCIVEGRQVEAIIHDLREQRADLLVLGLHQRDLYIARLWSTVYELAQEAPCSVLGVH
jgi:nucleotide-binding universal stress UspA family protein